VFSGLVAPTAVRFARDGRVFVAEYRGIIKVFDNVADVMTGSEQVLIHVWCQQSWSDRGEATHQITPTTSTTRTATYDAQGSG